MTDLTIVARSLRTRLFSTVTTALSVGVAVALMLVLGMMRSSASDAFTRGSGNMHLLVSADASPMVSVLNAVFYANPPRRPLTISRVEEIRKELPLGGGGFAIPTQQGDSFRGLPVLATTGEFFTKFQPAMGEAWRFERGRAFDKPFELVLGAESARLTGLGIGARVHLSHGITQSRQLGNPEDEAPHEHTAFTFEVVGILAPSGSPHDRALFTSLESTWILHAHDRREDADPSVTTTTWSDVLESDKKVTGLYIGLATRGGSEAPAILPQVFDRLRRDPSLTVAQPADEVRKLMRLVSNVDKLLVAMAAVVMASSGVGIMLALYNSMEQRRRQIAVLRVLGASAGRIFGLVLTESVAIGFFGAAVGLVLSFGGARAVAGLMQRELGLFISPQLPAREAVVILLATLGLSALAGVVPAVMAYRTGVAKNLRPLG